MITRKHLLLAILATCLLTMFFITIVPIKSQTAGEYDPWLDNNEDGKINIIDIAATAKAFGTAGNSTKNVNVTNWPQDRPSIVKEGIAHVVLVPALDGGSGNGYTLALGKPVFGPGKPTAYIIFDFEPEGQFINVSEVYINMIWRGDASGNLNSPHIVSLVFRSLSDPSIFDLVSLSGVLGEPCDTMPVEIPNNVFSNMNPTFNYTLIQPGMNQAELMRSDQVGDHIYVFSLELFIQYYYWG